MTMVIVVTEKHQNNYFIQVKPPFQSLNLVTPLLFEEMLVLTSYEGHPIKNETFFIVLKPVCAFS